MRLASANPSVAALMAAYGNWVYGGGAGAGAAATGAGAGAAAVAAAYTGCVVRPQTEATG